MSKTVEISDELYEKLATISNEMNSQDHRWTRMPYLFVLQIAEFVECEYHEAEVRVYCKAGCPCFRVKVGEDALAAMNDYYRMNGETDMIVQNPDTILDEQRFLFINRRFDLCYEKSVFVDKGRFLTHAAALRHYESNKHNYDGERRIWLEHAYRNPDMEAVQRFLCELTGWKLHT